MASTSFTETITISGYRHDEMRIAHHERPSLPLDSLCRRFPIEAYRKLCVSRPLRIPVDFLSKVTRLPCRCLQRLVTLAVDLKPQKELDRTSTVVDHNRRTTHRRRGHLYLDHERRVAVDVWRGPVGIRPQFRVVLLQLVVPETLHRAERVDRLDVHPWVPRGRQRNVDPRPGRKGLALALAFVRWPVRLLTFFSAVRRALATCATARSWEAAHGTPDVACEAPHLAHAQRANRDEEGQRVFLFVGATGR